MHAKKTGDVADPPSTRIMEANVVNVNIAGIKAQGTAIIHAGTATKTGRPSISNDATVPTQVPVKTRGNIWPPKTE